MLISLLFLEFFLASGWSLFCCEPEGSEKYLSKVTQLMAKQGCAVRPFRCTLRACSFYPSYCAHSASQGGALGAASGRAAGRQRSL